MATLRGLEPPTFWFVGGKCATRHPKSAYSSQENQRNVLFAFGWFRTALETVHGKLHGKFLRRINVTLLQSQRGHQFHPPRLRTISAALASGLRCRTVSF